MQDRLRLVASLALFATVAAPLAYAQDTTTPATKAARGGPGGGGPGGPGGGGPGGFGGFGGFGGPGGPGGRGGQGPATESAERLLQIPAVQDDLKLDDKAKAAIKKLGTDATTERTKQRAAVTKLADAKAAEDEAVQNAAMAEALAANGIQVDPSTLNNNGGRGGRGGRGGPGGGNNQYARQMMQLAMDALQERVDAAFTKLLDKKQKERLKQIRLQMEGTRAFTDPNMEVVDKLGLTEEKLLEIKGINDEMQQAQRTARMELFASFAPADANANNNNGGGRGGRGFPNLGNLDDATRAKMDQAMQELTTKNASTSMAAIGKLLTKTQRAIFNKMIGEPFDVALLRNTPGAPPATATAAAKPADDATAKPADAAAAKTADAATTKPADAATAKPAARKSLRDARGGN